jgi:hypothetical protein
MEAICSSEKSVDFQRTARRYIPEDRNLLNFSSYSEHYVVPAPISTIFKKDIYLALSCLDIKMKNCSFVLEKSNAKKKLHSVNSQIQDHPTTY